MYTFQGPAAVFLELVEQFKLKIGYAIEDVLRESRNFAQWGSQLFLKLNKTSANQRTW